MISFERLRNTYKRAQQKQLGEYRIMKNKILINKLVTEAR